MEFKVEQKAFAKALSAAGKFIPSRATHPVLENFKLSTVDGRLSIFAFDLSIGVQLDCLAEVFENGTTTVNAKLLSEIVSKSEGDVMVKLSASVLVVTTQKGCYELAVISANEYPELPAVEDKLFTMKAEALKGHILNVLFASSKDETKQVLTGVNFAGNKTYWDIAATDGHRLAVSQVGESEEDEEVTSVTIPARALTELSKFLSSGDVDVYYGDGQGAVRLPGVYLTYRTLEGEYPTYWRLVPQSFDKVVTVNRKDLLQSLDRVAVLSSRKNNIVQAEFSAENQQLILSVEAADVGSAKETLSVQLAGESAKIGFNVGYFKESLSSLTSTEVKLNMNAATSPVVLSPISEDRVTHLVMPVQMRS